MTVGERIKQRRKELNLTQTELAERMGYKSKVAISNVENGKEDLTTARVIKFANALECTPAYLHGWSDIDGNPTSQPTMTSKLAPMISEQNSEFDRLIDLYLSIPSDKRKQFVDYLTQSAMLFRN